MKNIAKILKETVERVARKRVRAETQALRKASGHHRKGITDLSARVKELERKLALLQRRYPSAAPRISPSEAGNLRFSAKGFQSLRKRLGLSVTECGILLSVSGRTVGQWERGVTRPKGDQLNAVAGLRKIGKREARMRIEEVAPKR